MVTSADIEQIRQTLKQGIKVEAVPQLFSTPKNLAERMVNICTYGEDLSKLMILEPSAGKGAILEVLEGLGGDVWAVEINVRLANDLEERFPNVMVRNRDFLECYDFEPFDKIIMNPPFAHADDIRHIKHALNFLAEGGQLVAICSNGSRQQKQLKPLAEDSGGFWEPLPAGTFAAEGTMVNTALLVIEG